jgi:hypothetical protein
MNVDPGVATWAVNHDYSLITSIIMTKPLELSDYNMYTQLLTL